ncbi:Pollen-specific leucine-rich repeat extensin-like protein 2 [Hibiscus syriacus]|uniref:Pollen-specific leucine-rich repeat extensin-like protein 2 n=1 Tax=Hibiscus syriacus TaxID=106335 RepID=A0A6A2X6H9_HIBSY|nr:Pollen-specific leucine-rich repeat extensin-like protein 2 [Hibiscus syriacus]
MTAMKTLPFLRETSGYLLALLLIASLLPSSSSLFSFSTRSLSDSEIAFIARSQLLNLHGTDDSNDSYESHVKLNFTKNWNGPKVCDYKGVFCAPSLSDPKSTVIAGVDLNHADIAGYLPAELGLLTDLALLHINSNRFCGVIPKSFSKLTLLHELDLFENSPSELFEKELDALFLNNKWFVSNIPETFGSSPVSVIVVANNRLSGCIPNSIGKMQNTLNEIVFQNNNLTCCLPMEIGNLGNVTVLDIASNTFNGDEVCRLSSIKKFGFSYNYFNGEAESCLQLKGKDIVFDDVGNCLPDRPKQKSAKECRQVVSRQVECGKSKCGGGGGQPPPKPLPPKSKPPPTPKPTDDDDPYDQSPVKRQRPPVPQKQLPPPVVQPPIHSPPPPVISPPPPVRSPPPPVHHPPPPPVHPPPPPMHSPPPSVQSPPPPLVHPPPPPVHSPPPAPRKDVILPPNIGFKYSSPPPPKFP